MISQRAQKHIHTFTKKAVHSALKIVLDDAVAMLQSHIIEEYDTELVDVVTDRNSKTNPNLYREEFIDRLYKFNYFERRGDEVILRAPDMNNFDFSGRLRVIRTIMEGVAGIYVEVNGDDFLSIFNKRPINEDPLDEYVPPKEQIYIERYTGRIRKWERDNNKKLVRYPFSNSPPIKIFEPAEEYVDKHMDQWLNDALELATSKTFTRFQGAKL